MAEKHKLYDCESVIRNSSDAENKAKKLIEEGFEYVYDLPNTALFRKKREPFDRELELAKLQIAAEDCFAGRQIDFPLYLGNIIVVLVFAFSIMLQYPSSVPAAVWVVALAFLLIALFCIRFLRARHTYHDSIRKLNRYVEDFKGGKPLPSLTDLCDIREKK
jgi:Flp pilus assembly protein TadB